MSYAKWKRASCAVWSVLTLVCASACDEESAQGADPALNEQVPDASSDWSPIHTPDASLLVGGHSPDAGPARDPGPAQADAGHSVPSDAQVHDAQASLSDAQVTGNADAGAVSADGTFASVYPLIAAKCAKCHTALKPLDLSSPEMAHAELVGAPAEQGCAGTTGMPPLRVVAGNVAESLLMLMLEGRQSCGRQMPPSALLPAEQVEVFRAWIAAGAPSD